MYIAVGTRLPYMVTGYNAKDFARKAKKIIVDIDKIEIKKNNINPNKKICCDAKYFLKKLYDYLPKQKFLNDEWYQYCKNIRKKNIQLY